MGCNGGIAGIINGVMIGGIESKAYVFREWIVGRMGKGIVSRMARLDARFGVGGNVKLD